MHPFLELVFHYMLCYFRQLTKNSNFHMASQILGISPIADLRELILVEISENITELFSLLSVVGSRNECTMQV